MAAASHRNAQRNEWLYYAYLFLSNFGLWAPIWIKYLTEGRGLELKWILAMDLPFWLLVAALQAPMGALADHIGRRRVLAMAGVAFSLTVLGFGFTTNYWLLFFDYMLWAFAMAMLTGADQALVYDSLKEAGEEKRFKGIASRGFAAGLGAGVVSVALGGYVASWTSLAFAVQVSAVAPLASAGVALAMHEPAVAREGRRYWAELRGGIEFAWRTPEVRYTLLVGSLIMTAGFGPVVLVQPFLIENEVATHLFGVYQAPLRLASVAAALVAFRIANRAGTMRLVAVACAAMVVSYAGLAAIPGDGAFALFGVSALMLGLSRPVIDNHLNERIPSERRATVLSVMSLLFALQVAFFEPALGFITDDVSLMAAFTFAAVCFALTMPPLLFLWAKAHGGPAQAETAALPAGAPGAG